MIFYNFIVNSIGTSDASDSEFSSENETDTAWNGNKITSNNFNRADAIGILTHYLEKRQVSFFSSA